jgi:hypothetical protein
MRIILTCCVLPLVAATKSLNRGLNSLKTYLWEGLVYFQDSRLHVGLVQVFIRVHEFYLIIIIPLKHSAPTDVQFVDERSESSTGSIRLH